MPKCMGWSQDESLFVKVRVEYIDDDYLKGKDYVVRKHEVFRFSMIRDTLDRFPNLTLRCHDCAFINDLDGAEKGKLVCNERFEFNPTTPIFKAQTSIVAKPCSLTQEESTKG